MSEINEKKKSDLFKIDPRCIEVETGFNKRSDFGDINELKESIKQFGVLQPLRCYKIKGEERYILIDGERRLRATMQAIKEGSDIARVPVILEDKKPLDQRIFEMLISNTGKAFEPIELAESYSALKKNGYTEKEIALKLGKTVQHVYDILLLSNQSKEVKQAVKDKKISATTVTQVAKKEKDPDKVQVKVNNAIQAKKTTEKKVTAKNINPIQPKILKFSVQEIEIACAGISISKETTKKLVEYLKSLL